MNPLAEAATASEDASGEEAKNGYLIILGKTDKGRKFRPSDWADRLFGACNIYAHEDNVADQVFRHIYLTERDGIKGVVVSHELENSEPVLYHFLLKFAQDNNLNTTELAPEQWHTDARRLITPPLRQFIHT